MENPQGNGWTFEWKISNLSYSWLQKGESIESPTFCIGSSTRWSLVLYPRGLIDDEHVGIYLRRENDLSKTKIIEVSFEFTFLNKECSLLNKRSGSIRGFARGSISGIGEFLKQDKLFGNQRYKFFPGDILIVQCTVWIKNEMPNIAIHTSVQTIFEISCRSWSIGVFSTLEPKHINHFEIINDSKKVLMSFCLISNVNGIYLNEILWYESIKSFSFEISVVDSESRKLTESHEIFTFNSKPESILLLSRKKLMQNQSGCLPNDVLSLACKYVFSTGTILHMREKNSFGTISPHVSNEVIGNLKELVISNPNEPHQAQALVDDLKSMYSDAILCDINLRTSTRTFPAHKTVLSARSSVFRRMFSNDMRENNNGHVDITDLEDDTIHQMLLYIYTDFLENLQFESASKLYSAADKYAIFSLKEKCSCYLKQNISPTKACDLLTLADRHQDDDLKRAVEDYILAHDKEVFGSLEWKNFMVTNLQLAADTMYRKVCPN